MLTTDAKQQQEKLLEELAQYRQEIAQLRQERADLELLLDFNTEHSTALEYDLNEENKSAKREFAIAQEIQAGFLPENLPVVPGWELGVRFKSVQQVGGDFYDVFPLPGDRLGLVVADVCDKGVGAAIFMALTRTLLRVMAQQVALSLPKPADTTEIPPEVAATLQAVSLTNEYLLANHLRSNMFATLFFGVLETTTGILYYVNGGHDAPIQLGAAGIQARLKRSGHPVGTLPDAQYNVQQTQLKPGETLFIYTDGIPDARNTERKRFTEQRLLALLTEMALTNQLAAETLLERVLSAVEKHAEGAEDFDDITALALHFCQA